MHRSVDEGFGVRTNSDSVFVALVVHSASVQLTTTWQPIEVPLSPSRRGELEVYESVSVAACGSICIKRLEQVEECENISATSLVNQMSG